MAQLTDYSGAISLTKQSSTLTFSTKTKYVPENIVMNISIPGIEILTPTSGTNSFYITVPNGSNDTVTFTFTVDSAGNTVIT